MPELPELEVVREVLGREITRRHIMGVEVLRPTVVRDLTRVGFVEGLRERVISELYPFRRRPELSDGEIARLYHAMRDTLAEAIEQVRAQIGDEIHLRPRGFLAVHNKGGAPCPRCGTPISQITARNRITSFCRRCQSGTLVRQ